MKKHINIINNELVIPVTAGIRSISTRDLKHDSIELFAHFAQDSLYRNSIYLIMSTVIMAFFGFFFWIISARIYSAEQIGIATTLISIISLISNFSLLGLNVGLVRFLPKSNNKNEQISSSFILTILASVVISVLFITGLHIFSPKLLFLRDNFLYMTTFVIFVAALSANTIMESIFVAYRSAKYTLYKNLLLSIVKLVLPIFLVAFSAYGIFASVGIANVFAFALSLGLLIYNFKYRPRFSLHIQLVKTIASYSFGNYLAGFINILPITLLPIIITNKIDATESAFFYIAMMIANFLFIIPTATAQSLFAEGSHNEEDIKRNTVKGIKMIAFLMLPLILFIILFGNYILLAFGKHYSSNGFLFLQLLAISGVFSSVNAIYEALYKINNRIKELITLSIINTIVILSFSLFFIKLGLTGIGISWMIGQAIITIIYTFRENYGKIFKIAN
jgi:O-antigen/teichoic acid export membrane protein